MTVNPSCQLVSLINESYPPVSFGVLSWSLILVLKRVGSRDRHPFDLLHR
jgi:hypothetical protein